VSGVDSRIRLRHGTAVSPAKDSSESLKRALSARLKLCQGAHLPYRGVPDDAEVCVVADTTRPVVLELGIEFVFEVLLFLFPYGADQMNLPHSFWLGLICWIFGTAIAIRMFWIFPIWSKRLTWLEKLLIAILGVAISIAFVYRPVMAAYCKRNGEAATPAQQGTMQTSPPKQEQPQTNTGKTTSRRPVPSVPAPSQTANGNNNAQIGSLSQGPGSIAQFGGANNSATIYNGANTMRIPEEKKKELIGVLSGETATVNIELCNGGNAELAMDIRDLFKAAGWDVGAGSFSSPCKSVVADVPGPEPADGKIIIYPNTPVSKIRELMKAIGLESHIHQGPTLFGSYTIMVGTDSN